MSKTKPAAAQAAEYRIPTLAEADDVYGALVARRAELHSRSADARRATKAAEAELAADTSREVRPAVAELLGDGVSAKPVKRQAVADARQHERDIEAALVAVEQRLRDAKTPATRKAVALVRPEFNRRMTALCDALRAADAAHREFDALCRDLESEDVSPAHLGARPWFLGDGKIANFLKEAGHAA